MLNHEYFKTDFSQKVVTLEELLVKQREKLVPDKYACIKNEILGYGSSIEQLVMKISTKKDNFTPFYKDFHRFREEDEEEKKEPEMYEEHSFGSHQILNKPRKYKSSFSLEPT